MAKKSWARRKRPKKTIGKCLKSNSIWTHWIHMTHAYNSLDQCQQANEYISGRFDVYFILACKRKWWAYTTEYNLCYALMFLIYHGRNADPFINKWIFFPLFLAIIMHNIDLYREKIYDFVQRKINKWAISVLVGCLRIVNTKVVLHSFVYAWIRL